MLQLGKWLDHQKTETSRNILDKYLARYFYNLMGYTLSKMDNLTNIDHLQVCVIV